MRKKVKKLNLGGLGGMKIDWSVQIEQANARMFTYIAGEAERRRNLEGKATKVKVKMKGSIYRWGKRNEIWPCV